ncbi:MAG: hypothetical protein ACKO96_22105, partial [Flammeovirgaceae bacterium]
KMGFAEYINKKKGLKTEGAFSNDGLFWVEPTGTVHSVPPQYSHQEWAEKVMNKDLEELFEKRWVRVQCIPGQYLYIDHRQKRISPTQKRVLEGFFYDEEEGMKRKYFPRGFVVER